MRMCSSHWLFTKGGFILCPERRVHSRHFFTHFTRAAAYCLGLRAENVERKRRQKAEKKGLIPLPVNVSATVARVVSRRYPISSDRSISKQKPGTCVKSTATNSSRNAPGGSFLAEIHYLSSVFQVTQLERAGFFLDLTRITSQTAANQT